LRRGRDPLTIERLADLYLASDKFKVGREATRDQFRRVIDGQIKPALVARQLVSITPADLIDWSQGIIDRGAPVTANQSFKILRLVWNWGRKRLVRENVPVFPLAGFGKPWDGERPRKRHLPPQLFGKFLKAVTEEPRLTAVWWLLMLLNLTRKTETCLLEKGEIVWKSERCAYLIIPGEEAKNHQPLFQPLTRYSEHLLRLALKHSGESRWVMPGRKPRATVPDRQGSAKDEDVPRFQRTGVPATPCKCSCPVRGGPRVEGGEASVPRAPARRSADATWRSTGPGLPRGRRGCRSRPPGHAPARRWCRRGRWC